MICNGCGKESPSLMRVDTDHHVTPKQAHVCPDCLTRIQAGLWISREAWGAIKPAVPYDALPEKEGWPDAGD